MDVDDMDVSELQDSITSAVIDLARRARSAERKLDTAESQLEKARTALLYYAQFDVPVDAAYPNATPRPSPVVAQQALATIGFRTPSDHNI